MGEIDINLTATESAKDLYKAFPHDWGEGGSLKHRLIIAYYISGSIERIQIILYGGDGRGLLSGRELSIN